MLPQALVQNIIICKESDGVWEIKWADAAPILNTNFFYIDSLIKESDKYKKFLRLWESVDEPNDASVLKLHQYYTSSTSNLTYGITIGDWVGRVKTSTNDLRDYLVLTQSALYYTYDNKKDENGNRHLVLNQITGLPCIIRPDLWGLNNSLLKDLSSLTFDKENNIWKYNCTQDSLKFKLQNNHNAAPLAFDTDVIKGRITYEGQLIAHVPVVIKRTWNSRSRVYEFILQFPNLNFPSNAQVEFW